MNKISITYSKNLLPFIHIKHNGLVLNAYYAKHVSPEFLKGVLHDNGYINVPDTLIEDIKGYIYDVDSDKDVTVVFSYTSY